MRDHDDISEDFARRLLAELAAPAFPNTVYLHSMKKEFLCELCGTGNWKPVCAKDGTPIGNLVTCGDCRAVYERPFEPRPIARRAEGGAPNLKTYGMGPSLEK